MLVNSRALHYPATRDALAEYGCEYSRDDDDNFGTIPTRHKLHLLAEYSRINSDDLDDIWELKDKFACEYFDNSILLNDQIKPLFDELKSRGMRIALGSNARYTFLEKVVNALGVDDLVDYVTSAQDGRAKPDPYMYTNAMDRFLASPDETIIFEDSEVGRKAAYASGAWVYEVESYDELSIGILNETDCPSSQFKWSKRINRKQTRTNSTLYRKWR
ncbi:HAD-superfamily hydrolase [Synechococcus phage S-CAM9]|uniref:HAD-superfamily hydrolase n=1 Tax=Synechococcus phage S-CAM9 TaxID=1883369 RepID=A0A1D8KQH8_9CAUD|nr:HAD-superfamily hydrolase [Synechococcus phage S-CAM9]AOV60787.1 HAD-superfamily hydrolase [Synechococcus phage S-CAM9]